MRTAIDTTQQEASHGGQQDPMIHRGRQWEGREEKTKWNHELAEKQSKDTKRYKRDRQWLRQKTWHEVRQGGWSDGHTVDIINVHWTINHNVLQHEYGHEHGD